MDWLWYISLTIIFYMVSLIKLKHQTDKDRIRETPIFLITLIFFVIFEYVFLDSLFTHPWFHLLGLMLSMLYSFSIYWYLKKRKRNIEAIFDKMLKENKGNISVLSFMQATHLPRVEVEQYLNNKLDLLQGSRTKTPGNIYYEFYNW